MNEHDATSRMRTRRWVLTKRDALTIFCAELRDARQPGVVDQLERRIDAIHRRRLRRPPQGDAQKGRCDEAKYSQKCGEHTIRTGYVGA